MEKKKNWCQESGIVGVPPSQSRNSTEATHSDQAANAQLKELEQERVRAEAWGKAFLVVHWDVRVDQLVLIPSS